ncbi:MAG: thioesterase domain-containing protein, partial [Actinophytocola sp.]|uniref:thioesterase domain-containing protein n=1 Tax=Actinophytocola sp. TaxID=1872138 RepID=UPI003C73B6B2
RTGRLHFAGRADDQVSVRGFRVEPAEVEAALLAEPGVTRAAVLARLDGDGEQALTAYVTGAATGDRLRGALSETLPSHLVPAHVVVLDEFPVTPNGKLDRRRLPAPASGAPAGAAPASGTEAVLRQVFEEVLGAPVGVHDSFFDHGGHSMAAARLIDRLRADLGADLPLHRVFATPTVAGLASALDDGAGQETGLGPLLRIRAGGQAAPVFCVHPAGGLAWSFAGLGHHLDRRHPVHGLQAPGLTEAGSPATVPALAARYVDLIRTVRPHGPYHLVGWSFGGLVAHEMAVRLQAEGEEVGLLAVLDAYPPAEPPPPVPSRAEVTAAVVAETGAFRLGDELVERLTAVYLDHVRAGLGFRPGVFHGGLTHIAATEGRTAALSAHAWSAYVTGAVERHDVPCTHEEMTTTAALARIGAVLAARLAELEGEDR